MIARITSPTRDNTPQVTFTSTKPGRLIYYGLCSSNHIEAQKDENTIVLNQLEDGTYDDCIIIIEDDVGNRSEKLQINEFVIDTVPPNFNTLSIISSNKDNSQRAKIGDNVTLKYTTDEASSKISSITIFGTQITLSDSNL